MAGTDLFYLQVKCSKTNNPFYIKYCKGADGVWVRMQGLKELQLAGEKDKNSEGMPKKLDNIRVSPRYSCPHCGSTYCGSDVVDLSGGGSQSGPLEIMLVFDTSGSMDGEPVRQAKEAAKNLVRQLDLSYIKIGLAVFAIEKEIVFPPGNDVSKIIQGIDKMDKINVGKGTSAIPFNIAFKALNLQGSKNYIILLTDGQWDNPASAIKEAAAIKSKGTEIIAIGFGGVQKDFLEKLASKPQYALFTDIGRLAKTFSEFSLSIIKGRGQ
jgi:hypothetical protein